MARGREGGDVSVGIQLVRRGERENNAGGRVQVIKGGGKGWNGIGWSLVINGDMGMRLLCVGMCLLHGIVAVLDWILCDVFLSSGLRTRPGHMGMRLQCMRL